MKAESGLREKAEAGCIAALWAWGSHAEAQPQTKTGQGVPSHVDYCQQQNYGADALRKRQEF